MTKISNQTEIERITVRIIVDSIMDAVKNSLVQAIIFIEEFCTFLVKKGVEKAARNISK